MSTTIEWTQRPGTKGETWNPLRAEHRETGQKGWHCEHVSEGCRNCYAERWNGWRGTGLDYLPTHRQEGGAVRVSLDERALALPLRWRAPRTVFVCSMTDLFGAWHSDADIDRVFAVMALCPEHTFIVLTKRPERMREYMMRFHGEWTLDRSISWEEDGRDHLSYGAYAYGPLPNVWAGVSVENQPTADERIPLLLETPAAVRLVSYEPALGAVDFARVPTGRSDCCGGAAPCVDNALSSCSGPRLDWIICGGESGPGARPMHPDWARSVRDQCAAAGVPYFHKQNGAWIHQSQGARWPTYAELIDADADPNMHRWPDGTASFRIGKARAGRLLDGREHNDMPAGAAERKRWDAVLP